MLPDLKNILSIDSSRVTADFVVEAVGDDKTLFKKLMSIFFNEKNCSILIDTCFKYLLARDEETAVRVNCMQLLLDLSSRAPEIRGELQAVIEFQFNDEPGAYQSRAKKILRDLYLYDKRY